jgi:spore coat protein A
VPEYLGTWVWGYLRPGQTGRNTHLGPVIVATRGTPTEMKFVNNLGYSSTTKVLAYRYATDQMLHWADPLNGEANMWHHMAMPPAPGTEGAENYLGPIPACVHLHGGEVPPVLDGGPDAWFLNHEPDTVAYPHALMHGHSFYSKDGAAATNYKIYRYPNRQEGAPIWFHDHTLGATRLNVYAGLAGGYVLLDPANDPANLPELVPLIIQDRMFDTYGQLFFPADSAGGELWTPNPDHPYWVPEFIGNAILVNGKTWPFLNVEPKRYTFLFLNGSNARTYEMYLENSTADTMGPPMWVIGTDGGYLDRPVRVGANDHTDAPERLVIMPGERYQVIIDFAAFRGQTLLLRNTAKVPYPDGDAVEHDTTDRIMQFRVAPHPGLNHVLYLPLISSSGPGGGPGGDTSFDPALPGATLRGGANPGPAIVRLADPVAGALAPGVTVAKTRQFTLNEVMGMEKTAINPVTGLPADYPGGPLEILVNNTRWNGMRVVGVTDGMYDEEPIPGFTDDGFGNHLSEIPKEGETEIWEYVNLTADAHPMHTHLTQFQIMNRQAFDVEEYKAAYAEAFPGGGYDPMTHQPYPHGVYIPSFGPPLDYNTSHGGKYGGNPNVTPFLRGDVLPPMPYEAGWKDTIMAPPEMITRIVVRFAPTDLPASTPAASAFFPFDPSAGGHGYVWHCHIVDHEDNEMMRPYKVTPNSAATRTFVMGTDY